MSTEPAVSLSDIVIEETTMPEAASAASDIICETCGKDIAHMYKGKGRKPKYCEEHRSSRSASSLGSGSTRASADVKAAVNTLDMAYNALSMVLLMTGATQATKALSDSLPGLRQQNEQFLAQDKDLAKRINAMGKTGGRYAFFAAQAMVLGPVAVLAAREYKDKFGNADVPESAEESDVPESVGGVFL